MPVSLSLIFREILDWAPVFYSAPQHTHSHIISMLSDEKVSLSLKKYNCWMLMPEPGQRQAVFYHIVW